MPIESLKEKVVTRFAPSPTGVLHVGSARTALYNFLFARKHGGKFILRIEDTDKERSKKEHEEEIISSLKWLGVSYDEIFHQSERSDIHKKYLLKMIEGGAAYEAEESKDGSGKIIRFKNPNEKVSLIDSVRCDVEFDTTDLGDFVIAKNIDTPLFHLAVVVDDFEMGITHIIRGEDHLSNTPRQILIGRAIGAPQPQYAHLPLILASDKSKLSKRHGAVSVTEYKDKGYLPQALLNFLALIGWNPGGDKEVFTIDELTSEFSLEKIQKGGAMFNTEKLDWMNKEYLKKLPEATLAEEVSNRFSQKLSEKGSPLRKSGATGKGLSLADNFWQKITPIILERINTFSDIDKMIEQGEWGYFFYAPEYDVNKLVWKKDSIENAKKHLKKIVEFLETADFESSDLIKSSIWDYATEEGRGNVLWPMRYALSGRDKSPDPFTLAWVLGKEETILRIGNAVKGI